MDLINGFDRASSGFGLDPQPGRVGLKGRYNTYSNFGQQVFDTFIGD